MTGPDHYREAERLAELATKSHDRELHATLAQVHATLAVAAATALGCTLPSMDHTAWFAAAAECRKTEVPR